MYDYLIVNMLHEERVRNALRRADLNRQVIITRPALPRRLLSTAQHWWPSEPVCSLTIRPPAATIIGCAKPD